MSFLNLSNTHKITRFYKLSLAICSLILLSSIQFIYSSLNKAHIDSVKTAVTGIFRSELNSANPWNIARAIEDLRHSDFLRCPRLQQLEPIKKSYLDLKNNGSCEESFLFLSGQQVSLETTGINGAKWDIVFFVPTPITTQMSLWLTRVLATLTLLLTFIYFKVAFDRQAKIQQLEVAHLRFINNLASQVAHDIRSPLSAITSLEKDLAALPEEKRILLRSAVNRIRDIANDLLDKNRKLKNHDINTQSSESVETQSAEPLSAQLLSSLIDPLISEKRLQFRSKLGVEISEHLNQNSYGLFAKIQPNEFKRMLSNLINNAVEAITGHGQVSLKLTRTDGHATIIIKDDGRGIPPDLLKKLGNRGETHGKDGGSGLGLYHARTSAESWEGSLSLESSPGNGTTVTIHLPLTAPPSWFVSELKIPSHSSVVVLDDDSSIHQIWQGRFNSAHVKSHHIQAHHFSTPDELRRWVKTPTDTLKNSTYLIDYELLGHSTTGLDLIEELGISTQSILVTSRYEEPRIRERCERLGVKLIPKGLAGFVPIEINSTPTQETMTILIDDDELIRMSWKMAAKRASQNFKAYASASDLLKDISTFNSETTTIYIDSNLADHVKGEDVAKDIHARGFKNIYLATGYTADHFSQVTWVKGIQGKDPPWTQT